MANLTPIATSGTNANTSNTVAAHTPGPWYVVDQGIRDSGGYICHARNAQHWQGQDERYVNEVAERAANARLIAAAPELFAALRAMVESITGADQVSAVNEACAAIAEATGETA